VHCDKLDLATHFTRVEHKISNRNRIILQKPHTLILQSPGATTAVAKYNLPMCKNHIDVGMAGGTLCGDFFSLRFAESDFVGGGGADQMSGLYAYVHVSHALHAVV
jgi:hypothetical protein